MAQSRPATAENAPDPVIRRLSLYLRELERLDHEGTASVSSRQLADSLWLTAAQVRKDLAFFGQFGRPGVGYRVADLVATLRGILGTDKVWNVVVVGVGGLGGALLRHEGFRHRGFELVAAVDNDPTRIGQRFGRVVVEAVSDLPRIVEQRDAKLAIVTVPAPSAEDAVRTAAQAGIVGILNFAPASLPRIDHLAVEPVDIAAYLERLAFQATVRSRS